MIYGITLNGIVDDILNDKNGGMPNDDYAREQIIFKVLRWRELLIRRDIERNGMNSVFQQTIHCLPLEFIDETVCMGMTDTDNKILRSVDEVPQIIRSKTGLGYLVTSTTDDSVFTAMKHHEARYVGDLRITAKNKRSYIKPDNKLYIYGDKEPRYVNFTAPFFDPRQVARYINCSGQPCYTDDDAFPITGDMLNVIYGEIAKELNTVNIYDEAKEKKKGTSVEEMEHS